MWFLTDVEVVGCRAICYSSGSAFSALFEGINLFTFQISCRAADIWHAAACTAMHVPRSPPVGVETLGNLLIEITDTAAAELKLPPCSIEDRWVTRTLAERAIPDKVASHNSGQFSLKP